MASDVDGKGELTIFRAGGTYQLVKDVDFGEQIMAGPVPLGADLLIRTKKAVYRFKGWGTIGGVMHDCSTDRWIALESPVRQLPSFPE